jgi:hypothetical protein
MADLNAEVDRFIAAWNEPDADRRGSVVEELFASDARYCNASEEFRGRDGCRAAITQAHDQFVTKGFVFAPIGAVRAHHDAFVFRWQMTPADGGDPAATGGMFAMLDDDGRVARLYQFLDAQPA